LNDENLVIGMLLNGASLGAALARGLSAVDFACETCRAVFGLMVAADLRNEPSDLVSIGARLPSQAAWLVQRATEAPLAGDLDWYVDEILAASWSRRGAARMASIASQLLNRAPHDETAPVQAAAVSLAEELAGGPQFGRGGPTGARKALLTLTEQLEQTIVDAQNGVQRGLSTGFPLLDVAVQRLYPATLTVIGARPGVGKTTIGCQIALHNALEGKAVAYFTREMLAEDLTARMVRCLGRIDGKRMRSGTMTEEETQRYLLFSHKLADTRLEIDDSYRGKYEQLELTCQQLRRRGRLDLVVIDYLQQLTLARRDVRLLRSEELNEITMRIKMMAISMGIPVVALAQLNRESAKSGEEPQVYHLKDAGGIEQEADAVVLLHCDESEDPDTTWALIGKNRNGEKCRVRFHNEHQFARLSEQAR